MADIRFLSLDEVLLLHEIQIDEKGGASGILSKDKLKGAIGQPKQTFDGQYLYNNLFEMATAYLTAIVMNHPFEDGNKRTAAHTAIAFLYLNGYKIEEFHGTELANLVLAYLEKEKTKADMANFFADRASSIEE